MVFAKFRIVVYPERRDEVLRTIRPVISRIEDLPGCLTVKIYQEFDNPNAITLMEKWNSEAALKEHIASDDFKNILAVLDFSREQPEVDFDLSSGSAGMEFIEAVRT